MNYPGWIEPFPAAAGGMYQPVEPLADVLQDAAHRLVEAGFLPEFEEYM